MVIIFEFVLAQNWRANKMLFFFTFSEGELNCFVFCSLLIALRLNMLPSIKRGWYPDDFNQRQTEENMTSSALCSRLFPLHRDRSDRKRLFS